MKPLVMLSGSCILTSIGKKQNSPVGEISHLEGWQEKKEHVMKHWPAVM